MNISFIFASWIDEALNSNNSTTRCYLKLSICDEWNRNLQNLFDNFLIMILIVIVPFYQGNFSYKQLSWGQKFRNNVSGLIWLSSGCSVHTVPFWPLSYSMGRRFYLRLQTNFISRCLFFLLSLFFIFISSKSTMIAFNCSA